MPKLMEVLEFLDNTGQIMVKRVPDSGECEIKWGAQLTVRESQTAVFFRDGKALDVFGPGRHVLQTQNIPLITKFITRLGNLFTICLNEKAPISINNNKTFSLFSMICSSDLINEPLILQFLFQLTQ